MRFLKGLAAMLALTILSIPAFAVDHYIATCTTSGAATCTIQQPATGARLIDFGDQRVAGASVYCAGAQTATLKWNGTAATATAGAEVKLPNTSNASGTTFWTASNVGSGTTGPVYTIGAGLTLPLDLSWLQLRGNSTAVNLSIATSGTCTITFAYSAK